MFFLRALGKCATRKALSAGVIFDSLSGITKLFYVISNNCKPPAGLLSPTGSLILAQGKIAPAVAALGWILKNTSQAESLPHRLPSQLAMYDASFQPAHPLPQPTQGDALG
jgi:hypothetical protein